MIYELNKCKVCGSEDLLVMDREIVGLDTYITYMCRSCDSIISKDKPKKTSVKEKVNVINDKSFGTDKPSDIYEKNHKAIYSIECLIEDDNKVCGTAFAVGSNGYLLTNAHVVTTFNSEDGDLVNFELNEEIKAYSHNHEEFDCDIIDVDLVLDLALLKINRKNLTSTKFGSYESLKTGENVVSIGNSKGEGMSITEGLVSDRNRQLAGQNKILISVPINHGNSGGPLFNMKGQVVGVVCSSKKNAVAMNYAIPVDQVVKFINKIENEQEIKVFN